MLFWCFWGISGFSGGLLGGFFLRPGGAEAWQAGPAGRGRRDILGARCAEPSEARLRAADLFILSLIVVRASQESDGAGEL